MQPNNEEEIEIDMKELFLVLLRKAWIIILAGILCAVGVGTYSKLVIKPIYTSSTKIYVINRQNKETTTYVDLQTGAQLTMDYKILVLNSPVTEQVIGSMNLNMTNAQLIFKISVNTHSDTRILEIKVNDTDPYIAKQLVDLIAEASVERMASIMEMEKANIVEPGNIPNEPSSPNILKNTLLGGFMGAFIAAFIIILVNIMNDSIKSIEDIEKYIRINTLGAIPFVSSREKINANFLSKEAYKSLRTNIQFCGKDVKTICITSCIPNEGKTVVSFRLASTIAESGKKVLFIGADLRKHVSYKFEQRVLKQLQKGKCRVLGAVLNKVVTNNKGNYKKYYVSKYGN